MSIFNHPKFARGLDLYVNSLRYFAKLLCCHLAEMGAPLQQAIADFAIARSNDNCILLRIDHDRTYAESRAEYGDLPYAAHGGLVIMGHRETLHPSAFHSTLTIGPIRYVYHASLTETGQEMMRSETPDFFDWCCERTRRALDSPLDEAERLDLGL